MADMDYWSSKGPDVAGKICTSTAVRQWELSLEGKQLLSASYSADKDQ